MFQVKRAYIETVFVLLVRGCAISGSQKKTKEEKGTTFFYSAQSPEKLGDIIAEGERRFQDHKHQFSNALPELRAIHNPRSVVPSVQYFDGVDGMKRVYEDILIQRKDVYAWTNFPEKLDAIGKEYIESYIPRRLEKDITVYCVQPKNPEKDADFNILRTLNCDNILIDDFPLKNGEIRIYGDKIAMIYFGEKKKIKSLIIESREMSQLLLIIFKTFFSLSQS